jgi:hypothetical protein
MAQALKTLSAYQANSGSASARRGSSDRLLSER